MGWAAWSLVFLAGTLFSMRHMLHPVTCYIMSNQWAIGAAVACCIHVGRSTILQAAYNVISKINSNFAASQRNCRVHFSVEFSQ
jgi:hypothetical protein